MSEQRGEVWQVQLLRLDEARPGDRLAKAVATPDGRVLLAAGMELTEALKRALTFQGIESIWVQSLTDAAADFAAEAVLVRTELTTQLRAALAEVAHFFSGSSRGPTGPAFPLPVVALRRTLDRVVTLVIANPAALHSLKGLGAVDEYTMFHSVEVSILSAILGNALGYSKAELANLALCALLHDVGKVAIPLTILNKPAPLTPAETEVMSRHTTLGWLALRSQPELSDEAALVALQHHERWGGDGYPLGLHGSQIHRYARICTVADVFNAMTADRVYRSRMTATEALATMAGPMRSAFEPRVLAAFLDAVPLADLAESVEGAD